MLLTPQRTRGAESRHAGQTSGPTDQWILKTGRLKVQGRTNDNKATCALANKLARICYAELKYREYYGTPYPTEDQKKMNRTAYAVAD